MAETRSWVEVDLDAVRHNVRTLRTLVEPADVVAVVKADGYGHGAVPVARAALEAGAAALAVATVAEGVELREAGVDAPVLLLSQPHVDDLPAAVAARLEPTIYTDESLATARENGPLTVHVKVDTGMHRVGATPDDAVRLAAEVHAAPELTLGSVWTHLAVADEPADPFTTEQLARYDDVLARVVERGVPLPRRHAANSAGALLHPSARYDAVRCGISIYGIGPTNDVAVADHGLRPALTWRAVVSYVKVVPAGDRVSYGLRHRFDAETLVATVPVGYADGVDRRWGEPAVGGEVLLADGSRRPVVGTVTMDQLLVDCGDPASATVRAGDVVTLLGPGLPAELWASRLGTIGYEIACGIGRRVTRRYV